MKKRVLAFMLVLAYLICIGCSNGNNLTPPMQLGPTPTVFPVEYETLDEVSTTGTIAEPETNSSGEITLECTDSDGGKYVFVQQSAGAAIMTGTWKFIKNDVVLFSGTFEGNISSIESLESLSLRVTEAANEDGDLVATKENNSFVFEITEGKTFTATIPPVEVVLLECTLNIMGYGDGTNAEGVSFRRICDEFMAVNPNIKINYEILYDEAYHQKVIARLAVGDVPDIAYMGADARWGVLWQEAGQQIDNNPYIPSIIDSSLIPDFFGTGVKPYIPLGGLNHTSVVAVNMELLDSIGGKIPTTYAEFVELAALCKTNEIECLSTHTHGADSWVWGSCILSAIIPRTTGDAKWIEKAVQGKVKFTDKGFVDALNVISKWVEDGIISSNSVGYDYETGISNFKNGKTLMYVDGQWNLNKKNLGDLVENVKLIPIPTIPGEKANMADCIAGAWQAGYGVTKKGASDPKVAAAAKEWFKFFFSYEETVQRLNGGAIATPILKDFVLPDDMDPIVSEKIKLNTYPSCYIIDSYLTGKANDTLTEGLQDLVAGKTTSADLATAVQTALDAQQ